MTITGGTMRITRLLPDGSPDPAHKPLVLDGATWTLNERTTAMADTTAPAPKPRPTRATIDRLEAELHAARMDLQRMTVNHATADRAAEKVRDELEAVDREARALAGCIAAIEAMRTSATNSRQGGYAPSYDMRASQPTALEQPIGRILLHLAARYGVAIQPVPEQQPEGPVLVQAPRQWADALQHLAEQGWPT